MGPATSTRTVAHALFDHWRTDPTTQVRWRATALRGEQIEVEDEDLERGERLGALVEGDLPTFRPEPSAPLTPDVAGGSEPVVVADVEGGHLGPVDPAVVPVAQGPARPKTVAPKGTWVDYAVARLDAGYDDGLTRDEAEDLNKDELIARFQG